MNKTFYNYFFMLITLVLGCGLLYSCSSDDDYRDEDVVAVDIKFVNNSSYDVRGFLRPLEFDDSIRLNVPTGEDIVFHIKPDADTLIGRTALMFGNAYYCVVLNSHEGYYFQTSIGGVGPGLFLNYRYPNKKSIKHHKLAVYKFTDEELERQKTIKRGSIFFYDDENADDLWQVKLLKTVK